MKQTNQENQQAALPTTGALIQIDVDNPPPDPVSVKQNYTVQWFSQQSSFQVNLTGTNIFAPRGFPLVGERTTSGVFVTEPPATVTAAAGEQSTVTYVNLTAAVTPSNVIIVEPSPEKA